jgi:Pentatricopeptide repeat domain
LGNHHQKILALVPELPPPRRRNQNHQTLSLDANNNKAMMPRFRMPTRLQLLLLLILSVAVDGFQLLPTRMRILQHQQQHEPRPNVLLVAAMISAGTKTLPATTTTTKMNFTVEDYLPRRTGTAKATVEEEDEKINEPTRTDGSVDNDDDGMIMEIPEELDETETFLLMIEDTPLGTLPPAEIEIIQELLMDDALSNNEVVLERLLVRLVDEVTKGGGTGGGDDSDESIMPSTEMVLRAMRAWQNRIGTDPRSKRDTDILPIATDHVLDIYYNLYDILEPRKRGSTTDLAEIALETLCYTRRGVLRQVQAILGRYDDPSPKMFEYQIRALARDGKPKLAEQILRRERHLVVSVDTLNSILTGYAKNDAGRKQKNTGRDSGNDDNKNNNRVDDEDSSGAIAEQLVVYMTDERNLQPNASTFTCLMDCYAQQRNWYAAERCQAILDQMLALHDPNIRPNIVAWTSVMSTWGKLRRPDAAVMVNALMERVQHQFAVQDIDAHVYVTWMRANAWSGTKEGLVQAELILQEMEELYLDGIGDESFQPTALSVRTMVDAWLQGDVPRKVVEASRVADQYEHVLETSSEIYGSVWRNLLSGWCTQAGNPVNAESYLERLIEREDLTIDSFCFDKIIEMNTYINDANSMGRSLRLFEQMEACRLAGRLQPTERVYTTFLKAMIKAQVPQLLHKVQAVVQRMHVLQQSGTNSAIQPTIFTYNAVLSACAAVSEQQQEVVDNNNNNNNDQQREEALALAVRTFHTIRSEHREAMDSISMAKMLQCANLLRQDDDDDALKRSKWLESTFRLACDLGLVNALVLENFQRLAPAALWQKTMTSVVDDIVTDDDAAGVVAGIVDESSIPLAWKENVRRQRSSGRTNADAAPSRGGGGGVGRSRGGNFQSNRSNNNNNNNGKRW